MGDNSREAVGRGQGRWAGQGTAEGTAMQAEAWSLPELSWVPVGSVSPERQFVLAG